LDPYRGVGEDLDLGELRPPASARRTAAGDDLPGADEQGAQSEASRIGRRMPWRRAVSIASGYPASAWRATPLPGSLVRTRSSRRRAALEPSATLTWPACRGLAIPAPPPCGHATRAPSE